MKSHRNNGQMGVAELKAPLGTKRRRHTSSNGAKIVTQPHSPKNHTQSGDADSPAIAPIPLNGIVQGDSIALLNAQPPGWIDLVFADPPFNIGYLYDGYDDTRKTEDYLKFSHDWMKAVHRALKPGGSFYLAIG